uniref:RRM domain-containing protein n=1 Tax=Strigamia maritima TaxID=126957 RepID=T1JD27_STRMM
MNKLYIGNLPADVNEGTLRQLFLDKGINCTNVLVKKGGYAFVDCPDQTTADRAIDSLNGYSFMGTALLVEPSVPRGRRSRTNRVQVSNISAHVKWEDLESLIGNFGTVQKCEQVPGKDSYTCVHVTYETQDQAQQAVAQLNNYEFESSVLKVDYIMEQNRQTRQPRGRPTRGGLQFSGMPGTNLRSTDFPLRILVLSEMVGAIIGRQGGTIRQITQQTRARVDVHRKDNAGSLEKAITVYGAPENCTNACRKILEVMCQEAQNTNKGEIPLKILAHNNLIGRIIGKNGNTIKHIMQETDTKITVSSIHDVNSFNLERTITIKGTVENMSKAEAMISAKLRQSYENDLAAMAPQTMMFPGLHPMAMMSTLGAGFPRGPAPYGVYGSSGSYMPTMYPGSMVPSQQTPPQETTFLYIPNAAVGAIIGTKGTHIRNIIRFSGASVKIAPLNKDEPADHTTERKVTIVGSPEAQWKAQFLIFEKMREEGFAGTDDVRLKVEIMVPSSQVGRIIGKGGQNVRELQRVTGSIIKLPEENQSTSAEETSVHIIGPFYSVQSAQRRIRAMITQTQIQTQTPPQIQRRRGQRGDQN